MAPVPPWATVTAALEVRIVAEAFGRVKVFTVVAGPVKAVKPFPDPPLADGNTPVTLVVKSIVLLAISAFTICDVESSPAALL